MEQVFNPQPYLTDTHKAELQSSGLTSKQIAATGHFSADRAIADNLVGVKLPGLIFRYCDLEGKPFLRTDGKPFYRLKPNWGSLKTEDSPKYLSPEGQGCRPYFSRLCSNWQQVAKSTKMDLWETEGEKKGDCACANELVAIAFSGVDGWVDGCPRVGEAELEDSRVMPELSVIDWRNRKVYQCFDSDIIDKIPVQSALARRAHELVQSGAYPYLVLLPNEIDGSKNGLDDFVVKYGIESLKVLGREAQRTPFKVEEDKQSKKKKVFLKLDEPESHYKALMAWAVLKETWAYRPGIGWYEWQGNYWKLKTIEEFEEILTRFMDAQSWKNRSSGLISSVVRELRSRLLVREKFWSPDNKLAFLNGTLQIDIEEFQPRHDPFERITKVRPYNFPTFIHAPDWEKICPNWLRYLNEATGSDRQIQDLLQAWLKYANLPRPKDRKAEIEKSLDLFGPKGTGKGTFLEVLILTVGAENIGPASPDTFKSAVGLGQLIDKDLAIDTDCTGFLENVGAYNKVVSNEVVEVKKLYRDSYVTRLGVAVVRAYNAFIAVPDGSEGLDRRLTVVPFQNTPKSVDVDLADKLRAELPGIFSWAWQVPIAEMKRRILSAGKIEAVAKASIERFEANNAEYRFLSEFFPTGRDSVKAGDLYQSYQQWCKENGNQHKSQVKFKPAIETLGCKRSTGKINGCYFYTIPKMANFDVVAHLGIVGRQLGDSCRDSSNPEPDGDRDSCRQFKPINSEVGKSQENNRSCMMGKELPAQSSTTVSKPVKQTNITVSEPSPTSPSTVSISETIRVGSKVHKRHNFGWTGVVQAIKGDLAEVLWYLDTYPSTIPLGDLRLGT
jgi:P4 family phage/plasmid primase-like protien